MRFIAFIAIILLTTKSYAVDIRNMVDDQNKTDLLKTIDPDKHIFGIPFGTSEDEFIDNYGKPTGYVKINATDNGMLYGKSFFFFFENGKLSGIRISRNILDWKITNDMLTNTAFDSISWKLSNGLREGTTKTEVKEILKDRLKTGRHGFGTFYTTHKAKVELDFSHMTNEGNDDSAYHLYGVTVRAR